MNNWQLRQAARIIHNGGVIAYPTEGVFGLGCDPLNAAAVFHLLTLKQRPVSKGLILIAAELDQLRPFIAELSKEEEAQLTSTWPGPHTWLLPARPETPTWLRGEHNTIAVRVTAHPVASSLCRATGQAIVSTSANRSGQKPATNTLALKRQFRNELDFILSGKLEQVGKPTVIRDLKTGRTTRP